MSAIPALLTSTGPVQVRSRERTARNRASGCIKERSAVCVSLLDRWNLGAAPRDQSWPIGFTSWSISFSDWGCSSAGRAPALQAGGHRFDPDWLHQLSLPAVHRLCPCNGRCVRPECNADRMGASAPPLFKNLTECGKRNASTR